MDDISYSFSSSGNTFWKIGVKSVLKWPKIYCLKSCDYFEFLKGFFKCYNDIWGFSVAGNSHRSLGLFVPAKC